MLLSPEAYKKIDRELAKFPADQKQSAVMAALAIAQDEKGWLSPELMQDVAAYLEMPAIAVQEVATFYTMYNLKPVGKYKLTICTNLPCQLTQGDRAAAYLKQKLGIDFFIRHETAHPFVIHQHDGRITTGTHALAFLQGKQTVRCGFGEVDP